MNSSRPAAAFRLAFLSLIVTCAAPQTQTQSAVPSRFEVASIKPSKPGSVVQDARMNFLNNRLEALNLTVKDILYAMSFFKGKIEGGPKWTETDRYDIIAKAEGDVTPEQRPRYIMSLLEDRFKLTVHHESREESGLALAIGKNPPSLAPAKDGEQTSIVMKDRPHLVFQAVNMFTLTNYLHQILRASVVDKTGISGKFDFTLDVGSSGTNASVQGPVPQESFSDRVHAAIEQFGFRLESQRVTVDVTVIDHVERPTEN